MNVIQITALAQSRDDSAPVNNIRQQSVDFSGLIFSKPKNKENRTRTLFYSWKLTDKTSPGKQASDMFTFLKEFPMVELKGKSLAYLITGNKICMSAR